MTLLANLRANAGALDLDDFTGKPGAQKAHRRTLLAKLDKAAERLASGRLHDVRAYLRAVHARVDGDDSTPDWVVPEQAAALAADLSLVLRLLDSP